MKTIEFSVLQEVTRTLVCTADVPDDFDITDGELLAQMLHEGKIVTTHQEHTDDDPGGIDWHTCDGIAVVPS